MKKEELEALRQELDRQGCDTYMYGGDTFDAEYVSHSLFGSGDWYGYNVDFDAIAGLCYRSDNKRVQARVSDNQNPLHWSVDFRRGNNYIELKVYPHDGHICTEIIRANCYLNVFPELVAYAQKYLARNWKRITDDFWKKAYEDMESQSQCG